MALDDDKIQELAEAPIKSRTDEGYVEERSAEDLIALKREGEQATSLQAVPWGMRVARSKPPSTLT